MSCLWLHQFFFCHATLLALLGHTKQSSRKTRLAIAHVTFSFTYFMTYYLNLKTDYW